MADTVGIRTDVLTIPVGLTVATFVGLTASLADTTFVSMSGGGTLYVIGAPAGTTMASASLAVASNLQVAAFTSPWSVGGPASFYLAATGATMTVHMIRRFTVP